MLTVAALSLTLALQPARDCAGVTRQAYALAELLDAGVTVRAETFTAQPYLPALVARWQSQHPTPAALAEWAHGTCLAAVGISGGERLAGD